MSKVAILSVTDKTGIVEFAASLIKLGFEILSTGGTSQLLKDNNIKVTDISNYTDFPEMMDGRVKTLHPMVHGGILYDRSNPSHVAAHKDLGARDIALVCVNLYAFEEQAIAQGLNIAKAIEYIDIGGPTLLRAAAKNHAHVLPVIDPNDYPRIIAALSAGELAADAPLRQELAAKTFHNLAEYNAAIANYLSPESSQLRYGENPHQKAMMVPGRNHEVGFAAAKKLQGKELSYNNYLDMDAAYKLVYDFEDPAIAIIKHNNPCGFACSKAKTQADIYQAALAADDKSAFGGIVAFNRPVEKETAELMSKHFFECILAPSFASDALTVLAGKKNLRLLTLPARPNTPAFEARNICGARLIQEADRRIVGTEELKLATEKKADHSLAEVAHAFAVAKHVKSNAIVLYRDEMTIGIGAGQMSRIDACELSVKKAKEAGFDTKGAILASDAFFPFRDTVDFAAQHGITTVVQPGGSMRDQESIDAANEHGIAMLFTGVRHFKH